MNNTEKAKGKMCGASNLQDDKLYSERKNSGIYAGDEAIFERRSENHGLQAVGIYLIKILIEI